MIIDSLNEEQKWALEKCIRHLTGEYPLLGKEFIGMVEATGLTPDELLLAVQQLGE